MYGFIDESRLANGEVGGLIEDPMVVEKSQGSGIGKSLQLSRIHRLYPGDIDIDIKKDINNKDIKECNIELSELDEFLHCRGCNDNNREMVGQDMAQSYNELFHAAQEPQEFISLEELGPRITSADHHCHPVANTVINNDQLYGDADEGQHQSQPRTYYNLSSLPDSCASVYFGDIRTGNNDIQAGEPLAPTATPATGTPLSPERLNRHQSNVKNNSPADREKIIGSVNTTTTTTVHALTVSVATSVTTSSTNCTRRDAKVSRVDGTLAEYDKSCIEPFTHPDIRTMQISQPVLSPTQSNSYHHHHHHHHRHHHHHHHHREIVDTQCPTPEDDCAPLTKRRKISCQDDNDLIEDATEDTKSVRTNADSKKQNHSEIEKRRRDKMNTYITELSAMIPMCHAMSRKLDKLTVLRMAVQHIKTILGAVTTYTEGHYKPAFLSDQELKTLILQAADGFLFVVGCDRGKILYVSESVSEILNYSQDDLLGQSWFDILHPKDVAKVKEQLSSSDLSPRERLIDARTMLPVKTDVPQDVSRLCPGARRSFFCRMKRKIIENSSESQIKEETDAATGCHRRKKQQSTDWKYCVIQCTGYLKSWAPAKLCMEEPEGESDGEACNLSCLVAVGRVQPSLPALTSNSSRSPRLRTIEFVSRHATDGKFLFVDQRATIVLGFLPQELLGTSMYEYYHHDDIPHLAESHKAALKSSERVTTQVYRFKAKGASIVRLQSEWRSFENPWTKDIEYLIAKNSAVFFDSQENSRNESENSNVQENYDFFTQSNASLGRLISSQVEISTAASSEKDRESTQSSIGNEANDLTPAFNTVLSSVSLNMSNDQGTSSDNNMLEMMGDTSISESPNPLTTDGSDEAAMAVIMSLLEADAGLGGPVDFSGLPWPLP